MNQIKMISSKCSSKKYLDVVDVSEAIAEIDENFSVGSVLQKCNDAVSLHQLLDVSCWP